MFILLSIMVIHTFLHSLYSTGLVFSIFKVNTGPVETRCLKNLNRVRQKYLQDYIRGALLLPNDVDISNDTVSRDHAGRMLLAVCATNKKWIPVKRIITVKRTISGKRTGFRLVKDKRMFWTWRGIYEWDMIEPLPQFDTVHDVCIT